ncbi:Alpha/beta hydrolase fold protein [Planktothrix serta PCC 8927]|uniref:Alpha/beta hydrolase fold protein n=1 Tax=Planktothrix serta PCC 8927 TaxID=671068 RepID=A0A7Z9C476_9CYAN|nr:alpha/beta hydrolase [Planktothrix serta]VXD25457.1 Alpha/beta hydrolase fold protein [Planktothrix serta PCC 8927]
MATIDIQGVKHTYELTSPTSSGDVLVFIHGWLLSRHYWQPVIDLLSPQYQCLSYDLRGFGDSQMLAGHPLRLAVYTPISYAEDLAILLDTLNLNHAWLVGHSLGGTIALLGADKLPKEVKGVICVNAGGGIYLKEEFEKFRSVGEKIVKFRPRWLCYLPLLDLIFTRAQVACPIQQRWGRQRLIDFVIAHPEAALGALLDSTTEAEVHRLPQVVSRLQQPVYFLAGLQDVIMEPQYVRHLASFHWLFRQGDNNVIEIPNCGHLAMVEQTHAVVDHIKSILTQY